MQHCSEKFTKSFDLNYGIKCFIDVPPVWAEKAFPSVCLFYTSDMASMNLTTELSGNFQ